MHFTKHLIKSSMKHQALIWLPSPSILMVSSFNAFLMKICIAPSPVCPGPYTLKGLTVTQGSPYCLEYAFVKCSPASFDTAYVQRASPAEPATVLSSSEELNAIEPKTSDVEKSINLSFMSFSNAA